MNTIYKSSAMARDSDDPTTKRFGEWVCEITWKRLFDDRMEDRTHVIDVYNAHVEHVKRTAPKSRLLVFEARQGWEPLCRFLGVDVPNEPYPRVNTTDDFTAGTRSRVNAMTPHAQSIDPT